MTIEHGQPLSTDWREVVRTALERREDVFGEVAPYAFDMLMEKVYETVRRGELSCQEAEEYCQMDSRLFLGNIFCPPRSTPCRWLS